MLLGTAMMPIESGGFSDNSSYIISGGFLLCSGESLATANSVGMRNESHWMWLGLIIIYVIQMSAKSKVLGVKLFLLLFKEVREMMNLLLILSSVHRRQWIADGFVRRGHKVNRGRWGLLNSTFGGSVRKKGLESWVQERLISRIRWKRIPEVASRMRGSWVTAVAATYNSNYKFEETDIPLKPHSLDRVTHARAELNGGGFNLITRGNKST